MHILGIGSFRLVFCMSKETTSNYRSSVYFWFAYIILFICCLKPRCTSIVPLKYKCSLVLWSLVIQPVCGWAAIGTFWLAGHQLYPSAPSTALLVCWQRIDDENVTLKHCCHNQTPIIFVNIQIFLNLEYHFARSVCMKYSWSWWQVHS